MSGSSPELTLSEGFPVNRRRLLDIGEGMGQLGKRDKLTGPVGEGLPHTPEEERMSTRKTTAALVTAMAMCIGAALPAWGQGPPEKHGSCKGFGEVFAAWAQGGAQDLGFKNGGQGIKATAHNGLFVPEDEENGVPEIDAQPPGSVAEVVHWEHSWACDPER